jgi:hypothetical protein
MQGKVFVERYRSYAAKCVKISRNIPDPSEKLVLLVMAQSWLKLAEQAAEAAETAVPHEPALSDMPEQGSP